MSGKTIVAKSIGEAFVNTDAYRAFKSATTPDRTPVRIAKSQIRVKSDPNPISTALPGAVNPTVLPGYTDSPIRRRTFSSASSPAAPPIAGTSKYRQLISVTNKAAAVKEGAVKPLSELGTQMAEAEGMDVR